MLCSFPFTIKTRNDLSNEQSWSYTKHHSHSTPAGAESDSNPTAVAPSQIEITDFDRSDYSTTSKRNGRVASFSAHPSDTDSGSDSTIHYGVTAILQPTTIATRKNW